MTDYAQLFRQTMMTLSAVTPDARRVVYDRARHALDNHLAAVVPPLADAEAQRYRDELEASIAAFEAESVLTDVAEPAQDQDQPLPLEPVPADVAETPPVGPLDVRAEIDAMPPAEAAIVAPPYPAQVVAPPPMEGAQPVVDVVDELPSEARPQDEHANSYYPSGAPEMPDVNRILVSPDLTERSPAGRNWMLIAVVVAFCALIAGVVFVQFWSRPSVPPQGDGQSQSVSVPGSAAADPTAVSLPEVVEPDTSTAEVPAVDVSSGLELENALAVPPGEVAMLFEATGDGDPPTPFNGTVDWIVSEGDDGKRRLRAAVAFPQAGVELDMEIRGNDDPALTASHLIEMHFRSDEGLVVTDVAGVLIKDDGLLPGAAVPGALAKVVEGVFLFAVHTGPDGERFNDQLLASKHWIDLAIVFSDGRRGIISMSKGDADIELFGDVFAEWRGPISP